MSNCLSDFETLKIYKITSCETRLLNYTILVWTEASPRVSFVSFSCRHKKMKVIIKQIKNLNRFFASLRMTKMTSYWGFSRSIYFIQIPNLFRNDSILDYFVASLSWIIRDFAKAWFCSILRVWHYVSSPYRKSVPRNDIIFTSDK